MTIVVTVKINDGIVLAADSATTFSNQQGVVVKIYNNANKAWVYPSVDLPGALAVLGLRLFLQLRKT
jgi:hypothetical protein